VFVKVAVIPVSVTGTPSDIPLSKNSIEPVAAGWSTVAVNVMLVPSQAGLKLDTSIVLVGIV